MFVAKLCFSAEGSFAVVYGRIAGLTRYQKGKKALKAKAPTPPSAPSGSEFDSESDDEDEDSDEDDDENEDDSDDDVEADAEVPTPVTAPVVVRICPGGNLLFMRTDARFRKKGLKTRILMMMKSTLMMMIRTMTMM